MNENRDCLPASLEGQGLLYSAAVAAAYWHTLKAGASAEAAWEAARDETLYGIRCLLNSASSPREYQSYYAEQQRERCAALRARIRKIEALPNPFSPVSALERAA